MLRKVFIAMLVCIATFLVGCNEETNDADMDAEISDVINDPIWGDYGRLIFPVNNGYYRGDTLGKLELTW